MKVRQPLILIATCFVMGFMVWMWFSQTKSTRTERSVGWMNEYKTDNKVSNVLQKSIPEPPSSSQLTPPTTNAVGALLNTNKGKYEQMREGLAEVNDVPIVFYGKLQDQFGNPVSGAEITGSIQYDNGTGAGVRNIKTASDGKGLFSFNDGNGESLSVTPRKEGYVIASTNAAFKYSHFYPEVRYVPDPTNPTVIEMWKLEGAEHLLHFLTEARVPVNGTKVVFDLQTGKQVASGGDVIIAIQVAEASKTEKKYDWQASIQAVDGGVIPFDDIEFDRVFQAPERGYGPEFKIRYVKNVNPWSTTFNGVFFIQSRAGKSFGKIGIQIFSDLVKNGTVPVILSGYINPVGSRNLEINPALVTEVRPK